MTVDPYLEPKTQLLVALSAAVAAKCQPCFTKLYEAADQAGATEKELGAAVSIASKVTAQSQQFMASFVEETTKGTVPAAETSRGAVSMGCCG